MIKNNTNNKKSEKRSIILNAALKIIKQKGFHRARMSDISNEAGISYGLIYHYFKKKERLFDTIIEEWWLSIYELLDSLKTSNLNIHDKLERIITHFFDAYQEKPDLMNIFITEISRSTRNLIGKRLEFFIKFISKTEALIIDAQKQNEIRSDVKARYLTNIFLGSLETFVSAMVLVDQEIRDSKQKEQITKSILEVFFNGASVKK